VCELSIYRAGVKERRTVAIAVKEFDWPLAALIPRCHAIPWASWRHSRRHVADDSGLGGSGAGFVGAITVSHKHGIGETKRGKPSQRQNDKEESPKGERMNAD
jgi:hypothetical protein